MTGQHQTVWQSQQARHHGPGGMAERMTHPVQCPGDDFAAGLKGMDHGSCSSVSLELEADEEGNVPWVADHFNQSHSLPLDTCKVFAAEADQLQQPLLCVCTSSTQC